jgi:hypothetical protein
VVARARQEGQSRPTTQSRLHAERLTWDGGAPSRCPRRQEERVGADEGEDGRWEQNCSALAHNAGSQQLRGTLVPRIPA